MSLQDFIPYHISRRRTPQPKRDADAMNGHQKTGYHKVGGLLRDVTGVLLRQVSNYRRRQVWAA